MSKVNARKRGNYINIGNFVVKKFMMSSQDDFRYKKFS